MMRDGLSSQAIVAAVAVAEAHGIRCDLPEVVADGSNVLVHLKPFFAARDLQGALWGPILSTRFADRRERAEEWMTICRARYRVFQKDPG
jgi:hypothetical protein